MNISWHKFECLGLRLVYDVSSGSLHEIDELGWDILNLAEAHSALDAKTIEAALSHKYPPEEIREVFDEVNDLVEAGLLGAYDSGLDFTPMKSAGQAPIKALCLHIAHACNISCRYCFASSGTFGGKRTLMSFGVAKAAVDLLLSKCQNRRHVEVDFFGGEPLVNWDVVKQTVEYGYEAARKAGKVIRFTLTTNGVALTEEIAAYLKDHEISVVLSLDGRQSINDAMRQYYGKEAGKSVYETIVPKFQQLVALKEGKGYYVRGTYTGRNLDFAADVRHLAELGFDQLSVEPVIAGPDEDYAITSEHVDAICREYDKLADWVIKRHSEGRPVSFFHFNLELDKGPCVAKRVSGCGAGNEYFAVTPEGDLYPCHQFVGRAEFKVGDVYQGVQDDSMRDRFAKNNLVSKPVCRNCWARYFCGGGCHANAHLFTGRLDTPHELGCLLQRKRIECALAIHSLLKDKKSGDDGIKQL